MENASARTRCGAASDEGSHEVSKLVEEFSFGNIMTRKHDQPLTIGNLTTQLRESMGLPSQHDSIRHVVHRVDQDDKPEALASDETIVHRELSYAIVGAAIAVHREQGPGQLESLYQGAMVEELKWRGFSFRTQVRCPAFHRGVRIGEYCADIVVEDKIVLELKSVQRLLPVHYNQLATYLRQTGLHLGLLINFDCDLLARGIKRVLVE
ncbi:MAG: GxxExxY protein [Kofleriaceae bacterium]